MSKTFLIGMRNEFSARINKWLFVFCGAISLILGIFIFYNDFFISLILGLLNILIGIGHLIYGAIAFSERSKLAPKIRIDDNVIEFKKNLLKPSDLCEWKNIEHIELAPYQISLYYQGIKKVFNYKANPDLSKAIKSTILTFAESKNIEVVGG